jgi:RNA polymerase sigma-70 factor (ECF subfamily)
VDAESSGQKEVDCRRKAWMVAAQAGDRAAYETLLRDCMPFIKRVARGQGIRPDLIDDAVQETLLTVHRARQTYDPNRSFTAWLRTIAQRRGIDVLRRVGRTRTREVKFVELRSDRMSSEASETDDRAQRFRDAALPHLDQVYTVARYLMRNSNDAEDAVQECYLRALRHFDSFQGPAMKPWLLAILKNVRNAEFMRRGEEEVPTDYTSEESLAEEMPMWQEPHASPEEMIVRQQDAATIKRLVADLPEPFREAIVLREVNDLSYREIAQLAGVQIGTVMSRLARARSMLRSAWNLQQKLPA